MTTREFIRYLDEGNKLHRNQVGGKGHALARLCQAGFSVPAGFIVTTEAYRAFIAANDLDDFIAGVLADDDLASVAARIGAAFEKGQIPPAVAAAVCSAYQALGVDEVAVRSSASAEDSETASFAGQYETVLGIVGHDDLLMAVRRCWASLWCERALAYRRCRGREDDSPAMAVIVQRMVPAAQAGVAFTLDPVSGRRDVIVVEAVAGRGETLVGGQVAPRHYIVQRGNGHSNCENGVLDSARLATVVRLAQEVEAWAGRPQDLEWALDDMGDIYLLQARPITVAGNAASEGVIHWSRDNVGEVMPDPMTPLSWSVFGPLGNCAFARVLRRLDVDDVSITKLFGRFYGRVYLNQTLFQAVMSRFYPSTMGWRAIPWMTLMAPRVLLLLHRLPAERDEMIRAVLEQRRSEEGIDLATLSQADLLVRLADWHRLGAAVMGVHLIVSVMAELFYQVLDKLLARWSDGTVNAAALVAGLTGVRSAEAGQNLAVLAQGVCREENLRALVLTTAPIELSMRLGETEAGRKLWDQIEAFLAEYGHSAAHEFELAAPRWRDEPSGILQALQAQVGANGGEPVVDPSAARLAVAAQIEEELGPMKRGLFHYSLRWAQTFTVARENLKYHFVIAYSRLRDLYLTLAARLVAAGRIESSGDVFFLTAEEVVDLVEEGLPFNEGQGRIAERRSEWEADRLVVSPRSLDQLPNGRLRPVVPSSALGGDDLLMRGLAASPGSYVGRARIVPTPADSTGFELGEVLVTPATSPGWAPLLLTAGALVTEVGGALSHGAIIAREYGLPAVLNVANATHRIRTGQLVQVDGSQGIVRLLEEVP